jgi:DNA-binding protein H-NS
MALKSMSIDRLTSLREKVDATLRTKITETRRDLEAKLSKLSRFGNSGGGVRALGTGYRPVAPKFRNPDNPSETWAGRGLKPRWMVSALKAGHKLEDLLIARPGKAAAAKATKSKKGRKASARKSPKPRKAAARRKVPATKATPQTGASAIAYRRHHLRRHRKLPSRFVPGRTDRNARSAPLRATARLPGPLWLRATTHMCPRMIAPLDPTDYSVVVKLRAPAPNSWRWEIYRAGRASPIEQSSLYFQTMAAAGRAGKEALKQLLHKLHSEYLPSALV